MLDLDQGKPTASTLESRNGWPITGQTAHVLPASAGEDVADKGKPHAQNAPGIGNYRRALVPDIG